MSDETDHAVCRGCGKELIGRAYQFGGSAYDPVTKKRCQINHYGGFVCSRRCDENVSLRVLRSMPGCGDAKTPDVFAAQRIRDNWDD